MDRPIAKEEIRKRRLKIGAGVVLTLAVAVGAVIFISHQLQSQVKETALVCYTVDSGSIEAGVSAFGKVVPAFEEIVNSPISSRIVEVYAQIGDTVEVGTPLLKLDLQRFETDYKKLQDEEQMMRCRMDQQAINDETFLSNLKMQIKIAEMKLDRMKVEWKNERYLDSIGSGTADQVRQAELAYTTAEMELQQLRTRLHNEQRVREADLRVKQLELDRFYKDMAEQQRTLDDARIRSPRKAVLTFINAQIGAQVGQGEQLAIVSDLNHFKIAGEMADSYAERVRIGAKVLVRVNRQVCNGIVAGVTPTSSNGVVAFSVQLDEVQSKRLRPGTKADLYVVHAVREQALRIPNASFYTGPGEYPLFVRQGSELHRRKVQLGECDFEHVEVIQGLAAGEEVVVSDMSAYADKPVVLIQ